MRKTTNKRGRPKGTANLPEKISAGVAAIAQVDPQSLILAAIDKDLPVESMERLLAMRREMKAEWARERYFEALAQFQKECPIIGKDRVAKIRSKKGEGSSFSYRYAPLETIIAEVQPFLEKWGFSWTCKPTQIEGHVRACIHAHHKDGHEEVTEFEVPLDPDAYMSNPQRAAAALTFARRYAFINAFGIVTKEEDNDAQDDEPKQKAPIQAPREKTDAVPVNAEVKQTDYDRGLILLKSTSTDPKTKQVVRLFTENEIIDYTHQAGQAKNDPAQMKIILDDIIATGKVRHKAVKGEA
jgi:hypothetical protein